MNQRVVPSFLLCTILLAPALFISCSEGESPPDQGPRLDTRTACIDVQVETYDPGTGVAAPIGAAAKAIYTDSTWKAKRIALEWPGIEQCDFRFNATPLLFDALHTGRADHTWWYRSADAPDYQPGSPVALFLKVASVDERYPNGYPELTLEPTIPTGQATLPEEGAEVATGDTLFFFWQHTIGTSHVIFTSWQRVYVSILYQAIQDGAPVVAETDSTAFSALMDPYRHGYKYRVWNPGPEVEQVEVHYYFYTGMVHIDTTLVEGKETSISVAEWRRLDRHLRFVQP